MKTKTWMWAAMFLSVPAMAETSKPVEPELPSVVMQDQGLSFTVPLKRWDLRKNDPRLDRLLDTIPDLGTDGVPFEQGWAESYLDQLRNGPRDCKANNCVMQQVTDRRIQQMDGNLGPQDDWTWTPPSR